MANGDKVPGTTQNNGKGFRQIPAKVETLGTETCGWGAGWNPPNDEPGTEKISPSKSGNGMADGA